MRMIFARQREQFETQARQPQEGAQPESIGAGSLLWGIEDMCTRCAAAWPELRTQVYNLLYMWVERQRERERGPQHRRALRLTDEADYHEAKMGEQA